MELIDKFTNCYNDLTDFEEVQASRTAEDYVHSLEVLRVHLDYLWTQVRRAYENCRDSKPAEGERTIDHKKLRENYRKALSTYKSALGSVNAEIDVLTPPTTLTENPERTSADSQKDIVENSPHYSIKLPACDTNTFNLANIP